jgi:Cof subfamily protein (haloacid dehalogenase superfamily)
MNYHLICSDVDGTLLNKERELSTTTINTIKKVAKHLPFVFISSRMPQAIHHLQSATDTLQMPLVAYNGGIIQHQNKTLFSEEISFELTAKIVQVNATIGVHLSLYHESDWFVPQDDFWANREANNTKVTPNVLSNEKVVSQWESVQKGAHKIMCMGEEHKIEELFQKLSQQMGEHLHLYRSKPTYIEIAPKSISKFTAIQLLLQDLYTLEPSSVVAYGDNYNDIDLLTHVGLGIAVSNAKPEVKAIAHQITLASYEDGVATSIQHLFTDFL